MLDDATLERVTRDAKQLSGFDNAPGSVERFHAEQTFSSIEVQVFEDEAHGRRIGERSGTRKDEFVMQLNKESVV